MITASRLIATTLLSSTILLGSAHAESFRIKNCSNHDFSVLAVPTEIGKKPLLSLKSQKSAWIHCMLPTCRLDVSWSGGTDDENLFQHHYDKVGGANYVLFLKTGKAKNPTSSKYCLKAFALKKGNSCDIFNEAFDHKDKLSSHSGGDLESC